jgi:Fe-Mn family superoxide dismutase
MPTRRQALKTLAAAAVATTVIGRLSVMGQAAPPTPAAAAPAPTGPFVLPPLPYAYDALEPAIDAETMHLHHDKHHAGYVAKLNLAVAKAPSLAKITDVDDLLEHLDTVPDDIRTVVRNNGGGHANHSLFWQNLAPASKSGAPTGDFAAALTTDLGGLDKVKEEMSKEGGALFGSGWVWLVLDGGKKLNILTLPNQDSPVMEGHTPIFGIDVWEHAYYLKYHNVRADYLKAIWSVVNWPFISERYAKAMAG